MTVAVAAQGEPVVGNVPVAGVGAFGQLPCQISGYCRERPALVCGVSDDSGQGTGHSGARCEWGISAWRGSCRRLWVAVETFRVALGTPVQLRSGRNVVALLEKPSFGLTVDSLREFAAQDLGFDLNGEAFRLVRPLQGDVPIVALV